MIDVKSIAEPLVLVMLALGANVTVGGDVGSRIYPDALNASFSVRLAPTAKSFFPFSVKTILLMVVKVAVLAVADPVVRVTPAEVVKFKTVLLAMPANAFPAISVKTLSPIRT